MVSKNILSLVSKYNEKGVFIHIGYKVYWFNGKRVQYWCQCGRNIKTYKNELYCQDTDQIFIYKTKKFIPIADESLLYFLKYPMHTLDYYIDDYRDFQSNYHTTILKQKTHKFAGIYMCCKNNFIYVFSTYYNEKYDIKLNSWSDFANTKIDFVCEWNGTLYGFLINMRYKIYDFELDKWSDEIVI